MFNINLVSNLQSKATGPLEILKKIHENSVFYIIKKIVVKKNNINVFVLQILQALLHYSGHNDHNVVTASLESLQQLFRTPPSSLRIQLLTRGGISRSYIFKHDSKTEEQSRVESNKILTLIKLVYPFC